MGIFLDQLARQAGVRAKSDPGIGPAPLDWHGLMARLAAAYAARQILALHATPGDTASGSFAPGVAREVAAWLDSARHPSAPSSPGVNLNIKADGKSVRTIERSIAGADRSIVRGRL